MRDAVTQRAMSAVITGARAIDIFEYFIKNYSKVYSSSVSMRIVSKEPLC